MRTIIRNCCLLGILWSLTARSQSPQLRYERPLLPGGIGANRVAPDVALLSGTASPDLRDLRLYDSAGKEVPYLLIQPPNPKPIWKSGRVLPVAATKTTSGFEVDLGSSARIDRLRLEGLPTPFLKRFKLEGSGDRSHWTILVGEGSLFDLPNEKLQKLDMEFAAGEFRYVRVTWDDRESGIVPPPRHASARLVEQRAAPPPLRTTLVDLRKLSASPGYSRFQVKLPGPHLPLAAVELRVGESRLLRKASVVESKLSGGEVATGILGSSELSRVVQGNRTASDLRIPIRNPEGREIEIVVEDGNNPPLNLSGVTLEFSPQPWIYLESRDGAALSARYGNSRLEMPRYDLEAMRQYIDKSELKEARWGEIRDSQAADSSVELVAPPQPGASVTPGEFRYSRRIPDSQPGLTALVLDAGVLAHSRLDLADLRIADADNHQIPYLLERRQDPLSISLSLVPEKARSDRQSHYRVDLPYENLPPAKLILSTTERTFQRNVWVEIRHAASDRRSDSAVETFASSVWRHSDSESPAPELMLDLPSTLGAASATVVVDEGDNHPLALEAPRLELPFFRLRYFNPGKAKLTLLYGNDTLSHPEYDIQLLAPQLVGVSSQELTLDQEIRSPANPARATSVRVFWATLIIAVLVVMALLVRLLRVEKTA